MYTNLLKYHSFKSLFWIEIKSSFRFATSENPFSFGNKDTTAVAFKLFELERIETLERRGQSNTISVVCVGASIVNGSQLCERMPTDTSGDAIRMVVNMYDERHGSNQKQMFYRMKKK